MLKGKTDCEWEAKRYIYCLLGVSSLRCQIRSFWIFLELVPITSQCHDGVSMMGKLSHYRERRECHMTSEAGLLPGVGGIGQSCCEGRVEEEHTSSSLTGLARMLLLTVFSG